ncbi:MAG: hypothetical protein H5U40_14850, partial [Polyangiaceae bacterium]|nr:hypothetical protein [Polyangiaceae bacterium]
VTVVSAGSGYVATLELLERGDLPVQDVVFLDSLYAGNRQLLEWVGSSEERRVFVVYHPSGMTRITSRFLLYRGLLRAPHVEPRSFELGQSVGDSRILVVRAETSPLDIPKTYFEGALRALAR